MTEFVIKAIGFGVIGLCGIILLLVWQLLKSEQSREGEPRKGILHAAYSFMAMSLGLALIIGFVQLQEQELPVGTVEEVDQLRTSLREAEDTLLKIRSAASPVLNSRMNILEELPPGPEKNTLVTLLGSLRDALNG